MNKPVLLLNKTKVPWFLSARFELSGKGEELKDFIKSFPGATFYDSTKDETHEGFATKYWRVPTELRETITKTAQHMGFEVKSGDLKLDPTLELQLFNSLGKFEPFQKPDIEKCLRLLFTEQAALIAYAMGLGKTPMAIELARQLYKEAFLSDVDRDNENSTSEPFDILIVCPAMAREVWQHGNGPQFKDNGFARWWPERYQRFEHRGREYTSSPFPIIHGKGDGVYYLSRWIAQRHEDRARAGGDSSRAGTVVVSYAVLRPLLQALAADPEMLNPSLIILDEAHYISAPKSGFSRNVFALRDMFPDAKRLALTGTPLTNPDNLSGLHTVLDWLWEDRFGTPGAFKFRYMNPVEAFDNKGDFRGYKYEGLNESTKEELRLRLAAVSVRLTKADVAHLLPPFQAHLDSFEGDRIVYSCDRALSLLSEGHEHVRIACHLHDTADKLYEHLSRNLGDAASTTLARVDGRETPEQRSHRLAGARASKRSITIATIDSTKVAIDLTFQTATVYAELSYKIEAILQNLGRSHRASSTRGHDVFILADAAGDSIAEALYRKATILSEILSAGTEEGALVSTLENAKAKGLSQNEIDDLLAMIDGVDYEET